MTSRRLPAEWEAQSAIMLTWPHALTDWHDQLEEVSQTYLEIARAILRDQNLLISCEDPAVIEQIKAPLEAIAAAHQTNLFAYVVPANDTWARDHGPITVIENGAPLLLDFTFNAWGEKFQAEKDDQINHLLHDQGAFGDNPMQKLSFILEGGAIDCNGAGTILTTEHCLLQATRNHQYSKAEIEAQLRSFFNLEQVLWLSSGYLEGDDTDAHIDTLARFVSGDTIAYVSCDDPADPHYHALKEMKTQLSQFRTQDNEPFRLVALPMPDPIYLNDERLPATYANFLITNHSILLPVYNVSQDQTAIEVIQACFPKHRIVPINCETLIKQHGSLHCITMQLPEGVCK